MKKVAIATLLGAILLALLEGLTYGILLPEFVDANRIPYEGLVKEQPDAVPYLLFNLLWAFLIAYVFNYWANIKTFASGAKMGAILMGAVVLGINLGYIAFFNLLENIFVVVPVKIVAMMIQGAIAGGVMATILGWGERKGSIHERALSIGLVLVFMIPSTHAQEPAASDQPLTMLPMERIELPIGNGSQEMEVVVCTPHTYDPAQTYPLLVVLDADPLLGLLKTVSFLWAEEGKAVPVILVGLPFGATPGAIWTNRSYYLLPDSVGVIAYYDAQVPVNNGGGAPELARFLHEEVLPAVFDRYSVNRERVGLAGFSMGGLFTAWHLVTHPGIFSDYVIIAPPLAPPFVGREFERATESLLQRGFGRHTRIYIAYAEDDLASVRLGAEQWMTAWEAFDDLDLTFRGEVIKGHRHDSGAIPALLSAYEFLYGR